MHLIFGEKFLTDPDINMYHNSKKRNTQHRQYIRLLNKLMLSVSYLPIILTYFKASSFKMIKETANQENS